MAFSSVLPADQEDDLVGLDPLAADEERRRRIAAAEEEARRRAAGSFASVALPNDVAREAGPTHGRAVMDMQQEAADEPGPLAPPPAPPPVVPVAPPSVAPPAPRPMRQSPAAAKPSAAPAPTVDTQVTPEAKALLARQQARSGEIEANRQVANLGAERGEEEARLADEQTKQEAEVNTWADKKRGETKSFLMAEREKIRNFKAQDLFEGREGARVGAWLMAGIGQFAASMSGGPNTALQVLNQATESFAKKERDKYEQLVKSGQMAAEDMDLAEAEIKNKVVGIRENFINRRTSLKARFEGKEAAARGDAVIAGLQKANVADEQTIADTAEKRLMEKKKLAIEEIQARASAGASAAAAAHSRADIGRINADIRKTDAETAVLNAGGANNAGGRAAGKQIDLGILRAQLSDDVKVIGELYNNPKAKIDAKVMAKVQDNITRMEGAAHPKDGLGGAVTVGLRQLGAIPRSPYEGLNPQQRRMMMSLDLIATKASSQLAQDVEGRAHAKAALMPSGDDPPEVFDQKVNNLLSMAGAIGASAGKYSRIAEGGAAEERGGLSLRTGPTATPQQVAQANQWLRDNPNDPRAAAVKAERDRLLAARSGGVRP